MRINAKTMGLERLFVLEYIIEYEDLFLCVEVSARTFPSHKMTILCAMREYIHTDVH